MTIAEKVKKAIAAQLCLEESEITSAHTFDALGADSLDIVEISLFVEDELEIFFPDDYLPETGITTVETYIAAVEKYLADHPQTTMHIQH